MSEKEQDRLVRSARSSHNARTVNYDPLQADRLWYKGQQIRLVGLVLVCAIAIGSVAYYLRSRSQDKVRENERIESLVQSTKTEYEALVAAGKYFEAESALQVASTAGLPDHEHQIFSAEIRKAKLATRQTQFEAAERAIKDRELAKANKFLADASAMDVSGPDDRRAGELQNRIHEAEQQIRDDEQQAGLAATRGILERSRAAADRGKFDESLALLEKAKQDPGAGGDAAELENQLRKTIGGRILILGEPAVATVQIGDLKGMSVGKTIGGFAPGPVAVLVRAPGYLPEQLQADLQFPEVTQVEFNLVPEAPGPIWTSAILGGHCGQELVTSRYLSDKKATKWHKAIKSLVKPCGNGPVRASKTSASEGELEKLIAKTSKRFRDQSANGAWALDELGLFVRDRPEAKADILKSCDAEILAILNQLEQACADCVGQRALRCESCDAKGKKKEPRRCPDCDGVGRKRHDPCKGTGKAQCKACNGKGYRNVRVLVPSPGALERWTTRREICNSCVGQGFRTCTCQKGMITCSKCDGTASRLAMGPCTACTGTGRGPACSCCAGSGQREDMNMTRRKEIEGELARMWRTEP